MSEQKIPLLQLFSAWRPEEGLAALADSALVTGAVIDKAARSIRAEVLCARMLSPEEQAVWEHALAAAYQMERVELVITAPPAAAPAPEPGPEPVADDPFARTEELRRVALKKMKAAPALRDIPVRQKAFSSSGLPGCLARASRLLTFLNSCTSDCSVS